MGQPSEQAADGAGAAVQPAPGRFVGGAAAYLLANVLNALIPFLLLPVLTRVLSTEAYGQVAVFQAVVTALGAVVGVGVVGAAGRKYFDGDAEGGGAALGAYIGACVQILLASAAALGLVAALAREQLAAWTGLDPLWIACALAVAAANCLINLRLGQWQVRRRALAYGVLQVSYAAANATLSLLLVVGLAQGAAGRIHGQLAASVVFAAVAWALLQRQGLLALFTWRPQHLRDALAFGVPLVPHLAAAIVLSTVDRFFIQSGMGLAAVGVYMVAVQLGSALALLFDAVNNAYVPWLFERLKRNVASELRQIVRYTYAWFAALAVVVLLLFVAGPPLVTWIAGPAYREAGELIGWIGLGQALGGMYLMVANYIFFSRKTWLLSASTLVAGAVNVALLVVLLPRHGLTGAALAFCTAMGVRLVLTWCVSQRQHPMPWLRSLKASHA